jgi:hypothetical protein
VQVAFDGCQAVAAVGGDCPWWAADAVGDPFNCRSQLCCIMGVSELDVMVEDDTVGVVNDLGLVAELDRLASRPLRIGRASTSCRLTNRLPESGITPAKRLRVCATTRWVRSSTVSRWLIAWCSWPLRAPVVLRKERLHGHGMSHWRRGVPSTISRLLCIGRSRMVVVCPVLGMARSRWRRHGNSRLGTPLPHSPVSPNQLRPPR